MQKNRCPGPNEPCWCGSRRKYKQCHRPIDEASPERKYAESQRVYATNWRVTAELQHKRGDYRWMAQQLEPYAPKRVFDVGCGSGHGLLAMIEVLGPDLRVVGLEENPSCLRIAKSVLAKAANATVIERVTTELESGGYRSRGAPIALPLPQPVALVEADVCNDPYVEEALLADGPFDAVTVWLSGVHMKRQDNETVVRANIQSDYQHRLFVQNHVYELADKLLRQGGVLQVVDRGEAPTTQLLHDDLVRAHGEQAAPTSLQVQAIAHAPWSPPENKRVPMSLTPGISGNVDIQLAMISVISSKT